jgi:hypothetical protein
VASDRLVDDILKKLSASVASFKHLPFYHFPQMLLQGRDIAFCFCDLGDLRYSNIGWRGRLHLENLRELDSRIPFAECPHLVISH